MEIRMESIRSFKRRQLLIILVNSVLVLDTAVTAVLGIMNGAGSGQVGNYISGIGYFKPYTMDVNILMLFASVLMLACCIGNLLCGEDRTPRPVVVFYFTGSTCLLMTMLTAALFLGPMKVLRGESYFLMFRDDMFFFHLLNPVIAVFSFVFLIRMHTMDFRDSLYALAPTVLYSAVYIVMVVITGKWNDFYGFTFGGRYYLVPFVLCCLYGIVFGLSVLLRRLHNGYAWNRQMPQDGNALV